MTVSVVPVPQADKPLLWRALQDYCAEMMQWGTHKPESDGSFAYPWFDNYWTDDDRWPFWALVDGTPAGFALVRREPPMEMAEFYTFPPFRRGGVGLDFARQILKRFPGPWVLSEYRSSGGAIAFWHKVIADYPYTERVYVGGQGVERLEQRFVVPDA
ncbi:MAG: hypothetical protein JSR60_12280 [Proteobacteria bacterium]|nr:hypothetical protein [Pseudomonadota bacterium]